MEAKPALGLGYSSCPNDTFMFHALVHGALPGAPHQMPTFDIYMDDIEALNARSLAETPLPPLAFSKVSAGAMPYLNADYSVLRSGAALGRGCGPLLVTREGAGIERLEDLAGKRVAIPGQRTTAYLLMRIFAPHAYEATAVRFEQIMPGVASGEFDAGLIIHESRFTYAEHGLRCLADLGELWEADTGLPLPLGLITARRDLDLELVQQVQAGISSSVRHAYAHPEQSQPYIREHAQEMGKDVCRQHIELYVNDFSIDIGDEGTRAIEALLGRGAAVGAVPKLTQPLFR